MKTRIVLFVAAALILFSFTVISKSKPAQEKQASKNVAENPANAPQGGLALEDRDQWK